MKLILKGIDKVFDTMDNGVHSIIIENQNMLVDIMKDLYNQYNGEKGYCVISQNDQVLSIDKYCEILTQFVPFNINTKGLIAKLNSECEKKAVTSEWYLNTMEELSRLEEYLEKIVFELPGDIEFSNISISPIIKAFGMKFSEDYDNLCEKLLDYIELVSNYDREKLFILINLRSFVDDENLVKFIDTIITRHFNVVLIDNVERKELANEIRYIIDQDLCEIF